MKAMPNDVNPML